MGRHFTFPSKKSAYLEAHCMNAAEWIACLLAFQIKDENHEHLGQCPDRSAIDQAYKQQFSQKLGYLKMLPQSEFNLIYLDYLKLNSQLFTHIELSVNNDGFVVQRGADDAPIARHRPSAVW